MSGLGSQLTKAMRVRTDGVRSVYTVFRRAARYWRDGERRPRTGRCPSRSGALRPPADLPSSSPDSSPR